MKAGKLDEAEKLYEIGRQGRSAELEVGCRPGPASTSARRTPSSSTSWSSSPLSDADDLGLRKELARRSLAAKDKAEGVRWATECLHVDVYDPECHTLMADAYIAPGQALRGRRGIRRRPLPQAQEGRRPQGPPGQVLDRAGKSGRGQGGPRRDPRPRRGPPRGQGRAGGDQVTPDWGGTTMPPLEVKIRILAGGRIEVQVPELPEARGDGPDHRRGAHQPAQAAVPRRARRL